MVMEAALMLLLFNGEDGSRCGVSVVHGIRGACVLCNVQQYGWTLYLKTTPSIHRIVIVRGAISSKTKVMFRTRMCEQSLLIVSSCYIRVQAMMIAIEEFLFPGES